MDSSPPSLTFKVKRGKPELIVPATPTPHEVKLLSDIDDQDGLRFNIPFILMYHHEPSMAEKDPVQIIRQALSETLVYYYPFAGRLKEGTGRKLVVDCNGEGVMFIEADADVSLEEFGDTPLPPFPCFEELLYDVPGSEQVLDSPLLLIQVTRLNCGGFIMAMRFNHTMSDGTGIRQFLNALAEMAQGASQPSILPVWCRELLMARDPPRITCNHLEFEQLSLDTIEVGAITRSFFFGSNEIDALRRLVPVDLRHCTTFDLITACFWYCRTKALRLAPHEDVRLMTIVNTRNRFNPPIPVGYYGNCFVYPAVVTTAGKLCANSFGYAVELVRKAKSTATEEYTHSVADFLVNNGRCLFTMVRSCIISDLTRFRFNGVDFGWGEAVCGGVAKGGAGLYGGASYIIACKNPKREEGRALVICLPVEDMKKFAKELNDMIMN